MKIRIKFSKHGVMKFIGHLDIMRYFQKAIRRAEIPIRFTEGFSPHMVMSFASPLGVGLTSDGEYMDIEVNETISSKEAVRRLNQVMVEGMQVLSYRKIPEGKASNAMSLVAFADYTVTFREGKEPCTGWKERLSEFASLPAILILKKSKKSEKGVIIPSGLNIPRIPAGHFPPARWRSYPHRRFSANRCSPWNCLRLKIVCIFL